LGETTARVSLKAFCHAIAHDKELQSKWLRPLSRSDAEAVTKLHKEKHGVEGMVFSIDCMHIF